MKDKITEINFTNFETTIARNVVLVDFWADWCHPCKMQHKVLEELAEDNTSEFKIATLNVDDNKVISSKLGVRNIPTLILFKDGIEIRRIIGLQSKEIILSQIQSSLSAKTSV
ncbi:MAG: thioredoxin [Bacteroidales bacterium]|nr:thioredoxin [Bacteroidales bacterium]